MFQLPAIILSVIIASLCALAFFLWKGTTGRQLALFWVASMVGFFLGQAVSILMGWRLLVIGQVHLAVGLVFSLVAILLTYVLRI